MISFLDAFICGASSRIQPIWNLVNIVVNVIMIGVPIALIIFGMWDLGKAVIASKEEEVKKATKLLGKRFLYAVGVFAVVWAVDFALGLVANMAEGEENFDYNKDSWQKCWKCNIRKTWDMNSSKCVSTE